MYFHFIVLYFYILKYDKIRKLKVSFMMLLVFYVSYSFIFIIFNLDPAMMFCFCRVMRLLAANIEND